MNHNEETEFDAYEVHPCVLLDEHGKPRKMAEVNPSSRSHWHFEQTSDDDPDIAMWALFGHQHGTGLHCISDHLSEGDAEKAMRKYANN
jgi:hypothetical protein